MSKIFDWNGHKFTIKAMPYVSPINRPGKCPHCNGSGIIGGWMSEEEECPKCFGRGIERINFPDPVTDLDLCKYLNDCVDKYFENKIIVIKNEN